MINKEFHGKHYYMILENREEVDYAKFLLDSSGPLRDYCFRCIALGEPAVDRKYAVVSYVPLGTFRGPQYAEWERIKARIYRKRRIMKGGT
jgi:hypothetical protein